MEYTENPLFFSFLLLIAIEVPEIMYSPLSLIDIPVISFMSDDADGLDE